MARKLTTKEKLYLFELSDDAIQKIHAPRYTDEFAEDSITEKEFKEMVEDRQLQYRLIRFWHHCETQLRHHKERWEMRRRIGQQIKKTILPDLYNGDEEIAEFYQPIRPIVIELLDKFFEDKHYFSTHHSEPDIDRLWAATDENTYLVAEAFEELTRGERDVRQCAAEDCKKLFIPSPRGHGQKYCSTRCRNRVNMRRKNIRSK